MPSEPVSVIAGKLSSPAANVLREAVRSLALDYAVNRRLGYIRTKDTWEGPAVVVGPEWSGPAPQLEDVAELVAAGCVVDLGERAFRPTPRGRMVAAAISAVASRADRALSAARPAASPGSGGGLAAAVDALLAGEALSGAERGKVQALRRQLSELSPATAQALWLYAAALLAQ